MKILLIAAFILGGLGACITGLNFYLTFARYPLHQLLKGEKPSNHVSGFPLFGSLFLWIAAIPLWLLGQRHWSTGALVVSLLDTGGLIWFVIAMALHRLHPGGGNQD